MSTKPIEQALDADIRLSKVALLRAAQRARDIARNTGTLVVIRRNGVLVHLDPASMEAEQVLQQPNAPY